jgi:ribosomal protein L21
MYSVVEIKGHQYKLKAGDMIDVEKIEAEEGKTLEFALKLVTCEDPQAGINHDPFYQRIAEKLKSGQPLDDYEHHMVFEA